MRFKMWNTRNRRIGIGLVVAALAGVFAGSYSTTRAALRPAAPVQSALAAQPATDEAPLSRATLESGFSSVVEKVVPAVVNISATKIVKNSYGDEESPFSNDPFFRQFFGGDLPKGNRPKDRREHGLGSGVIVSPDGYILTNNHVVDGASQIKITLSDKRDFDARVIGRDAGTDIALLKLDAHELPVLPFGDSSKVKAGDLVLAIGSPFGLSQTVTMGIVSATGRGGLDIEDYENFIQTDAAINPGNSGGALVNSQGQLIGINTAILSGGGGNQGVGFAIPVDMAREVMTQLMKQGKVVRGFIGATIQQVTPGMAKAFGLTEARGALIGEVKSGSPASRAGLQAGDVILAINGKPVSDMRDLRLQISMTQPGTLVDMNVLRNGHEQKVQVKLDELPGQTADASATGEKTGSVLDGVAVEELTPAILRELGLPLKTTGVVVSGVDDSSRAQESGLRRGDVIQQVNRKEVASVADYQRLLRAAGKEALLLLVNRDGHTLFMVVEP
jgi:serine protease Do